MLNHNYVLPLLALLLGMLLPLAYAETGKETYTLTWADAPPLVVASESSDETDVPSMDDVPKSSGETDVPSMDGVPEFSESSDVLPDPDTLTLTGSDTSPVDTLPTDAILTPEQILANLTLREKVGQLFIVRPEKLSFTYDSTDGEPVRVDGGKTALTDVMRAAYTRYPVGGFVLFADNIEDPSQLRQFLTDLNSLCPVTPFLAVDEEGGNVARLANKASLGIDNVGSMGSIGGKGDTDLAFTAGATIGSYLSDYGFTLDFAPVADLQGPVIGNRSFGTDPESVSLMVGSFIDGLHSEGIMSCLKHFPGLGSSVSDTHEGAAEIEKTGADLLSSDLIPFIDNLNTTDMVMVSHASMTGMLNDDTPASLSPQIITEGLRGKLGYTGVIITDSLEMRAVTSKYKSAEAAVTAINAGADILLMPSSLISAFDGVIKAVGDGRISEGRIDESVLRVLRLKLGG